MLSSFFRFECDGNGQVFPAAADLEDHFLACGVAVAHAQQIVGGLDAHAVGLVNEVVYLQSGLVAGTVEIDRVNTGGLLPIGQIGGRAVDRDAEHRLALHLAAAEDVVDDVGA